MKKPFEELLREFMAGRMSTKAGNAKILALAKQCFVDGLKWSSHRPHWRNSNDEWKLYTKKPSPVEKSK